jgi:hypothetical protein
LRKWIKRALRFVLFKKYYSHDSISEDAMSGTFDMYGWERTCLEAFVEKPERNRTHKIPRF